MLESYLPILLFIIMGVAFGVVPLLAGFVLAPRRPDAEKKLRLRMWFPAI